MNNKATYQDQDSRFIDERRSNIKSDLIEITHDKLENILLKHLKSISLMKSWLTPLSLLLTILIARLTARFEKFLGIEASVWDALFLLGLLVTSIWLLIVLIKMYRCRNKASIEFLMSEIKKSEE